MSLTMCLGSFIAGATSEGGGAVAYPVMTLGPWKIAPLIARDFSLMIQSVGMIAAGAAIVMLKAPVEWLSIVCVGSGGVVGIMISFNFIAPLLPPPVAKIFFVSTWASFAYALYLLNRTPNRRVTQAIIDRSSATRAILFITGIVGGIFTGIAGSGIDICSFCVLTLLFRVSEKVATPTSVVLMGAMSVFGFWYRYFCMVSDEITEQAWNYWLVCIPIVTIGAPVGSFCATKVSRLTLARAVYFLCFIQLLMGVCIIIPKKPLLSIFCASILFIASFIFQYLSKKGDQVQLDDDNNTNNKTNDNDGETNNSRRDTCLATI